MASTLRKVPPRFVVKSVMGIRNALIRTAEQIAPPQVTLFDHMSGIIKCMVTAEVARLKIADLLVTGPKTVAELARETGTNEDALWRTLRGAASIGIFRLREDDRFENNRLSEALRTEVFASMRDLAEYFGTKSNLGAWADVPETLRTGKNGFERVYGKSVWDYFTEHPHEGETFARAMTNLTEFDASAIATGYPFGELGTICDVAGGRGTLLANVLAVHTSVKGILFDAQYVLDHAPAYLQARGVEERVESVAGNFFAREIPKGADAYVLKDILHDWDDERSLAILKNVRAAMERGKRLLIVELLVERKSTELPGPLVDLHMMTVCCEGRQRSPEDFKNLLEKAGFRFGRVVPLSMPTSIVEAFAV
ncbi:MAG: methyltransferase [Polyangiaceae bacterium]